MLRHVKNVHGKTMKNAKVKIIDRIPMLKLYIYIYIQSCDGPETHEMLTVINVYYGYYGI